MATVAGLLFARGWTSLCTFVSFIVVARFLSPGDFGLFAVASAAALLPQTLVGAGFYEYVLGRDPDGRHDATSEACGLLSGVAGSLLVLAFAGIAWLLNADEHVQWMLIGLSLPPVLWGVVAVREAILIRQGRGRAVAAVLWLSETAGLATLLLSFWAGAHLYALVINRIVASVVLVLGYLIASGRVPGYRFDRAALRDSLRFSSRLLLGRVLDWANGYGGDLLVSVLMPVASIGQFRMGTRMFQAGFGVIVQGPSAAVLGKIGRAAADGALRMRKLTLRILRLQMALITPFFVAGFALAGILMRLVLGPVWHEAGLVAALLCLSTPAMVSSILSGAVLMAHGRSGALVRYQTMMILPMLAVVMACASFGAVPVAAAKATFAFAYAWYGVAVARELGACGLTAYRRVLVRTAISAMAMAAWCTIWMELAGLLPSPLAQLFITAAGALIGLLVFGAMLRLLEPRSLRLLRAIACVTRRRWQRRRRAAAPQKLLWQNEPALAATEASRGQR